MNVKTTALSILTLLTFAAKTEPTQPRGLICTESRSAGPITKAQFLYFKVDKLPEAQETIEFTTEECTRDLQSFETVRSHSFAQSSIIPPIRSLIQLTQDTTKELASGKTGKITKIVRLALKDATGPVVVQFEFTRTSHVKAPLTISAVITIFGTWSERPQKTINLLKATTLNNSFLQNWGTTFGITAALGTAIGVGVMANNNRNTRIANERRIAAEEEAQKSHTQKVFDRLKEKLQANTTLTAMYTVSLNSTINLKKKICTTGNYNGKCESTLCNKLGHQIWISFGTESNQGKINRICINNQLSMSYKLADKNDLTKYSLPSAITGTDVQADAEALEAGIVKLTQDVFNDAGY